MRLPTRLFRVARPAGFAFNYLKTLAQTSLLWLVFLIVVPAWVARADGWFELPAFPIVRPLAVAGFVALGALGLWGGFVMARDGAGTPLPLDTARELVISGPYRWVRNPMAISAPGQAFSLAFWHGSWAVAGYGIAGALLWNLVIRPSEERDLAARFGEPYERYRAEVRCWVPRRHPLGG